MSQKDPLVYVDDIIESIKKIAGLRHVISHEYARIDAKKVWRVIEKDLPELKKKISIFLKR